MGQYSAEKQQPLDLTEGRGPNTSFYGILRNTTSNRHRSPRDPSRPVSLFGGNPYIWRLFIYLVGVTFGGYLYFSYICIFGVCSYIHTYIRRVLIQSCIGSPGFTYIFLTNLSFVSGVSFAA